MHCSLTVQLCNSLYTGCVLISFLAPSCSRRGKFTDERESLPELLIPLFCDQKNGSKVNYFRETWNSPLLFLLFSCSFILLFFYVLFFSSFSLLSLPSCWSDLSEVMPSTWDLQGARRDKIKKETVSEQKSFLRFSPPFVCALIVEPFPFLDGLHYLWRSLKHTHTLSHTHAHICTNTYTRKGGVR